MVLRTSEINPHNNEHLTISQDTLHTYEAKNHENIFKNIKCFIYNSKIRPFCLILTIVI